MKQSVLEYKKLLEQEDLLVEFAEPEGKEGEDRPVTLVTYFSGGADQGTLFLCKGAAFKEAYLKDAVNRGAVAYVSEKKYEAGKEIPALIVNDARKAQFVLGEAFYDYPAKSLHVTALTGTKGKTTTAYYLQSMLDACLKKQGGNGCALLSSIEYYDGKTREASTLTTPESLELCRHMRNAVDAGLLNLKPISPAMRAIPAIPARQNPPLAAVVAEAARRAAAAPTIPLISPALQIRAQKTTMISPPMRYRRGNTVGGMCGGRLEPS